VAPAGDQGLVATATITVMFTDIVGSTALIDSLGDEAAERARRTHYGLLRAALQATNGQEVKNTGDGLMAVYASSQDAVRGSIAIARAVERHGRRFRPALQVRVGLHVGEAIRDEGDYFGATVNIARRLCDLAEPMQILATSVLRAVLGRRGDVGFRALGALSLRGFSEPVDACEVAWSLEETEGRALPAALAGRERMAFVGRREELKAVEREWADTTDDGPRLVAVGGEAGIGKTRLAKEFAMAALDQGAVVLFGRCDDDPLVPYQPFVEALRELLRGVPASELVGLPAGTVAKLARLVPELGAVEGAGDEGDPAHDRYLLFEAVRALLARLAAGGPVLFLVEDLHWADRPTLLLLGHLLSATERLPLLFLATYRDSEADVRPPLADLLAGLRGRDRLSTVTLGGLDAGDVAELVDASGVSGELAGAVATRTEGNPLFVRELLRDAIESDGSSLGGVPEGLRAIITRRLGRLGPTTQEVVTVAAVAGRAFEVEVVGRACGLERAAVLAALDEATASREIAEVPGSGGGTFAFSHELVRQALYAELPAGRRAELHRRVGEALERLRGDDEAWLSSLAHHFAEGAAAGVADRAVEFGELAGARALRAFAYEEAVDHYRRALDAARGTEADAGRTARLLVGLGRASTYTGDTAAAEEAYRAAADAARRAGSGGSEQFALAALGLGQRGPDVARADEGLVALLREAADGLGGGHPGLRAQVLGRLARELFGAGDRAEADALSAAALGAAREAGEAVGLASALNARRQCLEGLENLGARLAIDQEILAIADAAGDPELAMSAWASMVVDHLRLGDLDAVDAGLAAFAELSVRVRHSPRIAWYLASYRAMRALFAGSLDEAERLADEALAAGLQAKTPSAALNHAAQIATIRREQGRLAELAEVVEAFAAEPGALLAWPVLLTLVRVDAGDVDGARAALDRIPTSAFLDLARDDFWLLTLTLASEAVAAVGDAERAAVLYDLLLPGAGYNVVVGGAVVALGAADRYLGLLASTLGRVDDANRHFEDGCRRNDAMGAVPAGIATRLDWAAACLRSGDRGGAAALAAEAQARAEAAGLTAAAVVGRGLSVLCT
jgi:predicted ATPase/class 3 adenylate cyclase